jgi:hypothetical protein
VLVIVLILLAVPFWHFLKASWPTWGFLLLGFALLLMSKKYEHNPFVIATIKVLAPIMVALLTLLALELLFGTFAFFNPDRVAAYVETVLNVHFAITGFEKALGFVIPSTRDPRPTSPVLMRFHQPKARSRISPNRQRLPKDSATHNGREEAVGRVGRFTAFSKS